MLQWFWAQLRDFVRMVMLGAWALGAQFVYAQNAATHGLQDGQPQLHLPRVALSVGLWRVDAQVAASAPARQKGLMYRQSLAANEGMLFVFPEAAIQCFWMKNTPLALTAAFIAEDGTVVNLADMQPLDERTHCSARPVRFVLEMGQGWFAAKKLEAGARVRGLDAFK